MTYQHEVEGKIVTGLNIANEGIAKESRPIRHPYPETELQRRTAPPLSTVHGLLYNPQLIGDLKDAWHLIGSNGCQVLVRLAVDETL